MQKIISLLFAALMFLGGCATDTAVEEDTTDTAAQETTVEAPADTEEADSSDEEAEESETDSESSTESIEISASFEIDGEKEEELSGSYEVEEGTTLLDFMKEEFEVEETGGFIESINGYAQDTEEGLYWLYNINGEMAEVGAAEYVLEEGDEISWTLNPKE